MTEPWFPTQLLTACVLTVGMGFITGFIFSLIRTIFFGGSGD